MGSFSRLVLGFLVLLMTGCEAEERTKANESIINAPGSYWLCSPGGGLQSSIRILLSNDGSGVQCLLNQYVEPWRNDWNCAAVTWQPGGADNAVDFMGGSYAKLTQINPNDLVEPVSFDALATSATGTGQIHCVLASGSLQANTPGETGR